ncbi:MAG: hypothetical protein HY868_16785 [Chloroflexi bacterium]|nr:hypothetical protein [Chloroflexota bacterium]
MNRKLIILASAFGALVLSACGSQAATPVGPVPSPTLAVVSTQIVVQPNPTPYVVILPPATPASTGIADPFAYCTTIGTVDEPDARYSGPKTPDTVVKGLMRAMKLAPDASVEQNARLTTWRCMNNQVWACSFGANIPCQEKANTSRTPSTAITDFCKTNRNASVIPAVVTGRATVYEWRCSNGAPQIVKELTKPDARGFLSMFWYQIVP